MPPVQNILSGQTVDPVKVQRSKELRREMTPAEVVLWVNVRGKKLRGLHFRRQQVIHGFIADFYCHAAGLIVEVDGSIHDTQVEADREREAILAGSGFDFLRFTNREMLTDLPGVLDRIARRCEERVR